jgi:hypothetical protein
MKKLLPLITLFFALNVFSQKEANFWYFGRNAALDFNSGVPLPVTGSKLNTTEGCSSFSDVDGNLLFYVGAPNSDARSLTVWNKNNEPMPNGTGLQGDSSSSQSALTVPSPSDPNIYYLFTVGTTSTGSSGGTAGFFLYEVDMSLNGGLGDISTTTPVNLSDGKDNSWKEKVTAVRAKECNTYWVISLTGNTSASGNNEFYAYKVNEDGVDTRNPVISEVSGFRTPSSSRYLDVRGYLKVSPDGQTLVSANMGDGSYIFDFNDETGVVTNFNGSSSLNQLSLNGNDGYGVEFSTSSERLYISTGKSSTSTNGSDEFLYQFDVSLSSFSEINSSRFLVYEYKHSRGALQLGPDGKIYWSSEGANNISVINTPNELGAAVNYAHRSVYLGPGVAASQGLPPFLSSLLLPIEIKDADTDKVINNQNLEFCVGDSKIIESEIVTGKTTPVYEWFFNGETSPIGTTHTLTLTDLKKANSGTYTLTVKLTDDCGNITQYDGTFNVEVFDAATATEPADIIYCDDDLTTSNDFDLSALKDTEILDGLDPSIFSVLYFDTSDKAYDNTAGTDLPNPYTVNTVSVQTIYARVHNKNAPNACFAITEFLLNVTNLPKPTQPTVYRLCDDVASGSDTDGITNNFDLSSKDAEILGTLLNPTQYNVSYHTSLTDAQISSTTNAIDKTANYQVTNSQTIYVRVENVSNTNCNAISDDTSGSTFMSFQLIVDPLPVLKPNPELDQCISKSDTNPTVNLTNATFNISETPGVIFTYFEDAATTSKITNIYSYPVIVNTTQSVFVLVTTNEGCTRDIVELKINVGQDDNNAYSDVQPPACDDFLDVDGNDTADNSDTDNITNFYLDKDAIIAGIIPAINTEVFFYENAEDRNNTLNEIDITDYRNTKLDTRSDVTVVAN